MSWGVKANVREHKYLRLGALCWLHLPNEGWGNNRIMVRGLSRSGRTIELWVNPRNLKNYRAGWALGDPILGKFPFDSREAAQKWADSMNERYGS